MKSKLAGERTSGVEVLNISKHGFWISARGREHFLSFEHFPWFKDATVGSIINVKLLHSHHLYWPDLDVDLELESIESPEQYPLVDSGGFGKTLQRQRKRPS
jgi:hypothetical protein